ncbi:MAG: hypothetical protein CBB68_10745 [Rhodospirillaceae bacterium TMED8]|nr:hypothetical protein [Magnetovibrio sp.]OUT49885.1 MAG: hypothetical protein CBB68_10745 [Rhodospirillaceae bacterium TMED8]
MAPLSYKVEARLNVDSAPLLSGPLVWPVFPKLRFRFLATRLSFTAADLFSRAQIGGGKELAGVDAGHYKTQLPNGSIRSGST